MKVCSWCDQPIHGEAEQLGDDAASGVHPPAYWHADRAECGRRVPRTSPLDGAASPLQRHLGRALRPRSS
ncbi:hypothetical protein ACFU51_05065 [Streptomyces sp. NPDC057430]|uniref:hypothetical protein n=1 Tax=Streptomyces sp. NPDC057430 TaxID=3346131 RepID=UPI0036B5A803